MSLAFFFKCSQQSFHGLKSVILTELPLVMLPACSAGHIFTDMARRPICLLPEEISWEPGLQRRRVNLCLVTWPCEVVAWALRPCWLAGKLSSVSEFKILRQPLFPTTCSKCWKMHFCDSFGPVTQPSLWSDFLSAGEMNEKVYLWSCWPGCITQCLPCISHNESTEKNCVWNVVGEEAEQCL